MDALYLNCISELKRQQIYIDWLNEKIIFNRTELHQTRTTIQENIKKLHNVATWLFGVGNLINVNAKSYSYSCRLLLHEFQKKYMLFDYKIHLIETNLYEYEEDGFVMIVNHTGSNHSDYESNISSDPSDSENEDLPAELFITTEESTNETSSEESSSTNASLEILSEFTTDDDESDDESIITNSDYTFFYFHHNDM